jgi:hypothetical protein
LGTKVITDTNPVLARVFGEIGELVKSGGDAKAIENKINSFWSSIFSKRNQ